MMNHGVGASRSISDQRVEEVITKTLESMPKNATHWSTRGLAQQLGMSQSSIKSHLAGLRPAAPSQQEFLALAGSPAHRKGSRYRGPLHEAAGQRRSALRGQRRVEFRLLNAANLYCPCARDKLRDALAITCAMARPRSSRLWRWPLAMC